MNKNEVITLSSDDEEENEDQQPRKYIRTAMVTCSRTLKDKNRDNQILKKAIDCPQLEELLKSTNKLKKRIANMDEIDTESKKIKPPEIVDLVEIGGEGALEQSALVESEESTKVAAMPSNRKTSTTCITKSSDSYPVNNRDHNEGKKKIEGVVNDTNTVNSNKIQSYEISRSSTTSEITENYGAKSKPNLMPLDEKISQDSFYDEFVSLCSSLEPISTDRVRLTKKLYKRYEETNPEYLKTEEFKNLIEKCKNKINSNNLYLLAKEVCDELCSRKKIIIQTNNVAYKKEKSVDDGTDIQSFEFSHCNKKQKKIVKKIIKQLDRLGKKIHELEEAEVDLSDEEESSYIQLQRYRYRFCLVYKKLCRYTNEVSDANRLYNRKIYFSGSKYPEINKCIEGWLNKTKRFPDFTDILKLLDSQSSSLGLPSDRESIRTIAQEIFQKVGVMLQQRRKYDLWDSFCGFLDQSLDPALNDPELDKLLKKNYEIRMTRELEIMSHYTEMQDKQKLKAEEVPEDEALNSPCESDNEDDKEIEEIENFINRKLDIVINKEEEFYGGAAENENEELECIEINDSDSATEETESTDDSKMPKQSKNDFKNCKSLKWRKQNTSATQIGETDICESNEIKSNSGRLEDDIEKETDLNNAMRDEENELQRKRTGRNDSLQQPNKNISQSPTSTCVIPLADFSDTVLPRKTRNPSEKNFSRQVILTPNRKKMLLMTEEKEDSGNDNVKRTKLNMNFEARFCRVEYNFKNFCKVDYEKDLYGKMKKDNFRAITKLCWFFNRNRVKRNNLKLRTPFSYSWGVENSERTFGNFKFSSIAGKKCAMNEENAKQNVQNQEKKSKAKNTEDNHQNRENGVSGNGDGHERKRERDDKDNDENRKNEADNDNDDCEYEEEEENEDENAQEENTMIPIAVESVTKGQVIQNMGEYSKSVCSNTNETKRKNHQPRRKCGTFPKPTVQKKGRRKKWTSLVTAETPVEGKVVKAEVTLNEEIIFLGHQNRNTFQKTSSLLTYKPLVAPEQLKRRISTEPTDEERIKRFLLNSPSSISIIPPKKLSLSKQPSQETLKALATLKQLKEISTTRVIRNTEDDITVITDSRNPQKTKTVVEESKWKPSEVTLPITKVECIQGEKTNSVTIERRKPSSASNSKHPRMSKTLKREEVELETSTLKISSVWGNCGQTQGNSEDIPGSSSSHRSWKTNGETKGSKKAIEFVVLD